MKPGAPQSLRLETDSAALAVGTDTKLTVRAVGFDAYKNVTPLSDVRARIDGVPAFPSQLPSGEAAVFVPAPPTDLSKSFVTVEIATATLSQTLHIPVRGDDFHRTRKQRLAMNVDAQGTTPGRTPTLFRVSVGTLNSVQPQNEGLTTFSFHGAGQVMAQTSAARRNGSLAETKPFFSESADSIGDSPAGAKLKHDAYAALASALFAAPLSSRLALTVKLAAGPAWMRTQIQSPPARITSNDINVQAIGWTGLALQVGSGSNVEFGGQYIWLPGRTLRSGDRLRGNLGGWGLHLAWVTFL